MGMLLAAGPVRKGYEKVYAMTVPDSKVLVINDIL
jgi:hypothetical protein